VSGVALALALASAFVHAGWNLALARAPDVERATAVALLCALGLWAAPALVVGDVSGDAVPYIAASAVLELAYFALLAAAYRRAELSVVYPVARGFAPLLLVLAAAAGLGGALGTPQVIGVAVIVAGVVAVRGPQAPLGGPDLLLAGGVAVCVAAYTLVDREGVRHAEPLPYLWLVLLVPGLVYAALVRRARGPLRPALTFSTVLAGVGLIGAFALALEALQRAPAAAVAGVRETSVVIAVALAAVVLGEPVGQRRLAGAVAVAAGVALIAT
jgi:drug/metabolite transporter (DMT)-like permease